MSNLLGNEKSPYLRHAADQKIEWHPWSEAAFTKAERQGKPVFLSTGAVWCHWCHVMAKECFYDDEIAAFLNEFFINIKLDRDERPDIDRRYQMSVAVMGQGGGWPLTVFLTHDKKPFFGGTYFPPEDRLGRPGFKRVIRAVRELFDTKQDEIAEYSDNLISAISEAPDGDGAIDRSQLDEAVRLALSEYDGQSGGFGTAPKFPMPGVIEFLMGRYYVTRDESIGTAVRKTLDAMASGGMYDHIGGGFHRYSTDSEWIVPHFEKMADDNAWLLKNYLHAYAVFGDQLYKDVAAGIIGFLKEVLSDPEGGFYASQDADVTPDDEGGYFTWTEEEMRRDLDDLEFEVLSSYLFDQAGAMHHDPSRKVLFAVMGAQEVARKTGRPFEEVMTLINSGKEKLAAARNRRELPFIDKTLYTSINGMMIAAFFLGYRILRDTELKDFAIKSLDRILATSLVNGELLHTEGTSAFLDDYMYLIEALVAAYEATGHIPYLDQADDLMQGCINKLWDDDDGGFFDTDEHLLGIRMKEIQDNPRPSANSLAIRLLLKLHDMTGKDAYFTYAGKALKSCNRSATGIGIHGGYYMAALDAYFNFMKLTVNAPPDSELADAARGGHVMFSTVVYADDRGAVVPCIRGSCFEPVSEPAALRDFFELREFMKD